MRLKDIGWNILGLSLPLVVAIITIPSLVDNLGAERFGLLALAWGLIGYAGALDLGIGRAVTQMISSALGRQQFSDISSVFNTGTKLSMISGLIASGLIVAVTMAGGANLIKIEQIHISEIFNAMLLMSIAMPAQAVSSTYKGVCEALQKFKAINILRIFLGVANFAGPFLMSLYTVNLTMLVGTLVLSRIIALYIYRMIANSSMKHYSDGVNIYFCKLKAIEIFKFGGWVTISSILSPIMTQSDRFVIGAVISASAVSVYVLPYDIVLQTLILVGAISTVAFPTLTKLINEKPNNWRPSFNKWTLITSFLMTLVLSVVFFSLPYVFPIWLGNNFDERSILIGQILCFGVLANSVATMYYALLHARSRADITAKIHMIEFPLFIVLLYFFVSNYGLNGAAIACVIRMIFDLILLVLASKYMFKDDCVLPN